MALISIQEISLALGGPLLIDKISLQIEMGERIANSKDDDNTE